jgi:hypothetical protein
LKRLLSNKDKYLLIKKTLLLLFFFASLSKQAQEPVSIHLSEKDGLPDKEFYDIIEDNKGFIWLGADKGLFRYNGKTFKNYINKNQRGLSVFNVQQDHLKRIWCNNVSGQFFYVEDDKLHLFIDLSKQLKGELANFIINEDFLWVFTLKYSYKINFKTKLIEHIYVSRNYFGVPHKINETIFFGNSDSISSINSQNKIKHLLHTNLPNIDKKGVKISQGKSKFFKIGSHIFMRQNRSGLNFFFKINLLSNKVQRIKGFEQIEKKRVYNEFVNGNEVWLVSSSGVWVYELIGNNFKLKKRFFKDTNITKVLKDKDKNYWFTSLNKGIYVIPNIHIENNINSQINKNIISLDKISENKFIFGTANGDVGFYDALSNKIKIIELPTNDRVSSLKYIPKTNSIIVSKDLSSYIIDYKSSTFIKNDKSKSFHTIKSFTIIDNKDLLYTDHKSVRLLKNANYNNKEISISNGQRTYTSHFDKRNKNVYVAYINNLIQYDSLWNSKAIQYKNKAIHGKSINQTLNGIIWVASFKDGVFGIKNNEVVYHYNTTNGLTSNNIQKIKADQNKLWIALDNSIQVLDVVTKELKTLTKSEGILSYGITGIEILKNKVLFSSSEGLFSLHKEKGFKTQNPEVYFNRLEINEKDTLIVSNYELTYNQNAIKIGFNVNGFLYNQKGKYKYRLKGFNDDWITTDIGVNSVKYNSLPAGAYVFQVQPNLDNKTNSEKIKELTFLINKPFWQAWWFIIGASISLLGSINYYFRKKIKEKEKERITQLEKLSLEKELIAINLTALRSQMNPHFIFNALNSIQDLVLKQDTDATYDSIVLFSELIRNALSYSNQDFITIEEELNFLKVYLELENLRFGDDFNYTITYNSIENLEIPSLLIQPFIENSLVHGLLHKSNKKELDITFKFMNKILQCVIVDNGVGRNKATEIANRQGHHHESFALGAIEKRLEIFKKQYGPNIGYIIDDLYQNETSKGTKVTITMPFNKRF